MDVAQIEANRLAAGVSKRRFCGALASVLPVLRLLRDNQSGWKFWIRLGLSVAITALEAYAEEVCT